MTLPRLSKAEIIRSINYAPAFRGYGKAWDLPVFCPSLDRWLYLALHHLGWMGVLERKILETWVRPGNNVVDVGGNIGLYALCISRQVGPGGRVTTFEPIPELFAALCKSIEANQASNIRALPWAVGAQSGLMHIRTNALNSGDNRLTETAVPGLEVSLRRLDDLISDRPIDFIKIDVQGFELEVLIGMGSLLSGSVQPILFCEVSQKMLVAAGTTVHALGSFILSQGYHIYLPRIKNRGLSISRLDLEELTRYAARTLYFDILAFPPGKIPAGNEVPFPEK
jgi:FkbM family methyltransferase